MTTNTCLVLVHVRLDDALGHVVGDERVSAERRHVRATDSHHLGDEAVQEAVQTALLHDMIHVQTALLHDTAHVHTALLHDTKLVQTALLHDTKLD